MPKPPSKIKNPTMEQIKETVERSGVKFPGPVEERARAAFDALNAGGLTSEEFWDVLLGTSKIGKKLSAVHGEGPAEEELEIEAKFLSLSAGEEGQEFGWWYPGRMWAVIEDRYFNFDWLPGLPMNYTDLRDLGIWPKDMVLLCKLGKIIERQPAENRETFVKEIVEFGLETNYQDRPQKTMPYVLVRLKERLNYTNVPVGVTPLESFYRFRSEYSSYASELQSYLQADPYLDFEEGGDSIGYLAQAYLNEVWEIIEDKYFGWLPRMEEIFGQGSDWNALSLLYLGEQLGRKPVKTRLNLLKKVLSYSIQELKRKDENKELPWAIRALLAKIRLKEEEDKKLLQDEPIPATTTEHYENKTEAGPLPDKTQTVVLEPSLPPGEIIKRDLITGLGYTVEEAAKKIGMDDIYLHHMLGGRKGLTQENVAKLSPLFDECRQKTGKHYTVRSVLMLQVDNKLDDLDIAPHLIR